MTKPTLPDLPTREDDSETFEQLLQADPENGELEECPETLEQLVKAGFEDRESPAKRKQALDYQRRQEIQEVLDKSKVRVPKLREHLDGTEANVLPSSLDLDWVKNKDLLKASNATQVLAIIATAHIPGEIYQEMCEIIQSIHADLAPLPETDRQKVHQKLNCLQSGAWILAEYARERDDAILHMAPYAPGGVLNKRSPKQGGDARAKAIGNERHKPILQEYIALRQEHPDWNKKRIVKEIFNRHKNEKGYSESNIKKVILKLSTS